MIVVLGLVVFVAAVVISVAGILTNGGYAHLLAHGFSVFGYHVTGSTGDLFLYGVVVGAAAMFGLSLLLTGARRTSRRGQSARRVLALSQHETAIASRDRDSMIHERESARA